MKTLNLSLEVPVGDDALAGLGVVLPDPAVRGFRVAMGTEMFSVEVRHLPELAPYAGSLPAEPRRPSDVEVLQLAAGILFEGLKGGAR